MTMLNNKQKPYIPDSSHAEEWETPDVFIYRGMRFKVMPDGKVVRLRKDGERPEEE